MPGPFDKGLDPIELAMLLAISEDLSEEEKLREGLDSESSDEFEDDDCQEDEEDSTPERDDDIF